MALALKGEDGIAVVAEAASTEDLVSLARDIDLDVVVIDPEQMGAETTFQLVATGARVLLVRSSVQEQLVLPGLENGCGGYLYKDEVRADLLPNTIREVAAGHYVLSEAAIEVVRRSLRQKAALGNCTCGNGVTLGPTLTARERQVLDLVGRGLTNKVIAERLTLSQSTVKTHVQHIFEKLGVSSRLDVIRLVQEAGSSPPSNGSHPTSYR